MNAHELAKAMLDAKADIDEKMLMWEKRIDEDADADDRKRRAMARAYTTVRDQLEGKATVGHLNALVDLETSDVQREARHAEDLKKHAKEAVDGAKHWLSALQSISSLTRAEAELARWEPRETA